MACAGLRAARTPLALAQQANDMGPGRQLFQYGRGCSRTAETARQESAALVDRVSFLVIEVQQQAPGLTVQVNGRSVPNDRLGRLYAVDPGSVTVDAVAEGYAPFRATASLAAAQQARIQVSLAPAGVAASMAPPTSAVTVLSVGDRGALPVATVVASTPVRSPWRVVGLVAMGAGVTLGVVGLVTGLRASGIRGDLDARCPAGCGPNPPPDVLASVDEGRRMVLLTRPLGPAERARGARARRAPVGTTVP